MGEKAGRYFSGPACSSGQSLDHPEDGHSESQEGNQAGAVLRPRRLMGI